MSPHNPSHGPVRQANGQKPPARRIVPAIPLALTKRQPPKPVAPKPKSEASTTAVGAEAEAEAVKINGEAKQELSVDVDEGKGGVTPTPRAAVLADVLVPPSQTETPSGLEATQDEASEETTTSSEQPHVTPMLEHSGLSHQRDHSEQSTASSLLETPASAVASEESPETDSVADRPSMRQLRTELPPAFVPHEQQTPQSATESSGQLPVSFAANGHMARQSTNSNILFGSGDSEASSPMPSEPSNFPHNAPQFLAQDGVQAPQLNMPPGLGYRFTEQAGFPPISQTNGTQTPPYNIRRDVNSGYYQPSHASPTKSANFHYPPRQAFTPAASRQANGVANTQISHNASPISSVSSGIPSQRQDTQRPVPIDPAGNATGPMLNGQGTLSQDQAVPRPQPPQVVQHLQTTAPPNDSFLQADNAQSLRDHISRQYASAQFSDCRVHAFDEVNGSHRYLDAHKVIISRSRTLAAMIRSAESPPTSSDSPPQIPVSLHGRYETAEALMEAVKVFYGGPLLQMPVMPPFEPGNQKRVETSLQYLATGAWLQADQVAQRGMEITLALLYWDTLPGAIEYAFEKGISTFWQREDGHQVTKERNDSVRQPDWTESTTSDVYQLEFQRRLLDWIVHYFPTDFYLDTSVEQAPSLYRLPAIPTSHQRNDSQADPRLSKIRFGDMEADGPARPHAGITTTSTLLLSFPFPILKGLLEHWGLAQRLGADTVGSITRSVVGERETRRKRALQACVTSPLFDHTARKNAVQTMYWEESVVVSSYTRSGCSLVRRSVDVPSEQPGQ